MPYLTASNYLGVPAGDQNLKVNAAGTATTVIDADLNLVDGTDYTVIASGLAESIEPIVLQDDNSTPAAGNARVRAIHGAPGAPSVDIYITAPGADLETAIPQLVGVEFGTLPTTSAAPTTDARDAHRHQERRDRQRHAHSVERAGANRDRRGRGGRRGAV